MQDPVHHDCIAEDVGQAAALNGAGREIRCIVDGRLDKGKICGEQSDRAISVAGPESSAGEQANAAAGQQDALGCIDATFDGDISVRGRYGDAGGIGDEACRCGLQAADVTLQQNTVGGREADLATNSRTNFAPGNSFGAALIKDDWQEHHGCAGVMGAGGDGEFVAGVHKAAQQHLLLG